MNRLRTIDFLRGIAVILVLFRHHKFLDILSLGGWIGVDLFFVLSGYLVSSLLFREYLQFGSIHPGRFLVRRGFKIYPLFYVAILLTIVGNSLFGLEAQGTKLLGEVVFLQNYLAAMWNHTWSLAVEEHFYFGCAALLFLASKNGFMHHSRRMVPIMIVMLLLPLLFRILDAEEEFVFQAHLFPTHLRADSLLFGVLIAYLHIFQTEPFEQFVKRYTGPLLAISFLCILPAFILPIDSFFIRTIGLSLLYIGFGSVLSVFVVHPKTNERLNSIFRKPLVDAIAYVGLHSYGVYLFHMFVIRYGIGLLRAYDIHWHYRIEFLAYFMASIAIGIVLTKVVEQPFLRWRERVVPRRTKAPFEAARTSD